MTAALKLQDAIDHVRDSLKLSAVDAAAYVQLCMSGPSKVSDMATALSVHRNDVYRSLERLGGRGLVETTLEKPARYLATDPRKVFDAELEGRLATLDQMRASRSHTTRLLQDLQSEVASPEHTSYRIIQGRQEIGSQRRRMIQEARREIVTVSTHAPDVVLAEYDGSFDAILARVKEAGGPLVRTLLAVTPEVRAHLEPAASAGPRLEMRHFASDPIVRFTLVDDRELLLNVVNDAGRSLYAPDEVALLTTARGLVDAERIFFDQCWRQAQPVDLTGRSSVRTPVASSPL